MLGRCCSLFFRRRWRRPRPPPSQSQAIRGVAATFGAFLRELNQFVFSINDDRLDRARWKRVRSAWADLEGKRCGREIDSIE